MRVSAAASSREAQDLAPIELHRIATGVSGSMCWTALACRERVLVVAGVPRSAIRLRDPSRVGSDYESMTAFGVIMARESGRQGVRASRDSQPRSQVRFLDHGVWSAYWSLQGSSLVALAGDGTDCVCLASAQELLADDGEASREC